jgi:hypothetical protein
MSTVSEIQGSSSTGGCGISILVSFALAYDADEIAVVLA